MEIKWFPCQGENGFSRSFFNVNCMISCMCCISVLINWSYVLEHITSCWNLVLLTSSINTSYKCSMFRLFLFLIARRNRYIVIKLLIFIENGGKLKVISWITDITIKHLDRFWKYGLSLLKYRTSIFVGLFCFRCLFICRRRRYYVRKEKYYN